ncbi:MAG: PLP-dependent aspartate aminotransferase family protein [Deltaproteobacteria bacterium]|jgi:cystathionine beta-lyase/cystathionine gamma-synthase|nr:PLP-dependent aspartate aminotransferase family protein [Deltaproteobacteria bacterium]
MKLESICVHGAKDPHNQTGAIAVPIYQSATYAHPGVGASTGYDYARAQNPTREPLERLVAALEGGAEAMAFASGMAALDALMGLFNPGDHIIATSDLYGGSVRLFKVLSERLQIAFDYIDTSDLELVKRHLGPRTKGVFIETPSNPMMNITDIRAIREAVGPDILLVVDNTFLTPILQRPLTLGADMVLHSGTKYLGGHNDTLSGFLITNNTDHAERLRYITKTVGSGLTPFDSFLTTRGLKTLHLRVERAQDNALKIAKFLEAHPRVKKVYYPGLPGHRGHEIMKRQSRGFGAMISFEVESEELAKLVLHRVKMILFAESLGGAETLITYPLLQTHAEVPEHAREILGINERLLRLSVGIESLEDIQADLEAALK